MKNIICCPKCKAEYLPVEIFIPDSFFNKRAYKHVIRENGKIIDPPSLDTVETYTCDKCRTKFEVTMNVSINTNIIDTPLDSEHVTTFKKPTLFLDEE